MKHSALILALIATSSSLFGADNEQLQKEITKLKQQTSILQKQLDSIQSKLVTEKHIKSNTSPHHKNGNKTVTLNKKTPKQHFHTSTVTVHTPIDHPETKGYYPTALIADEKVISYIAGTPVVTSPYLGERPAFDGSDYIVNISSINRDIRLMQQRRKLYRAYEQIGYDVPNLPIIALSGKSEPVGYITHSYMGEDSHDLTLGSSELDVAAALNDYVEAFVSVGFDDAPGDVFGGSRAGRSAFNFNLGFVNIGNLDETPFYFTAGQLYAPFGRYSSSMISSPVTLVLTRTKTRPFILGYKSQTPSGPYAAVYGFKSETTLGGDGVFGLNLGYSLEGDVLAGDFGLGYIGSVADSGGMQNTGSPAGTTFGGFGSLTNGTEAIRKVPGFNVHGNLSFDRYSLTAEWVGSTQAFNPAYLSFDNHGAKPQAAQLEAGATFKFLDKPASVGLGYQWSKETLALNLPHQRVSSVFNISIWKDTVESLEYRHDIDFNTMSYANGAAPVGVVNATKFGTGKSSDMVTAQIGVYF